MEFNEALYKKIKHNWDIIAKPLDSMGKFEELIARIGAIQGNEKPELTKKAMLIFCADNGIVSEGVSQSGQEVTRICAENIALGKTTVGIMAREAGAEVFSIDVGINYDNSVSNELEHVIMKKVRMGTRNFLEEPAMTLEETKRAIETGIEAVKEYKEKGYTLLGIGEMGIGNTTTTSAVAAGLLKLEAKVVTGRGAGLDDKGLERKREVVQRAIEKYDLYNKDALTVLQTVGGFDIAAMTGACIGGKKYGVPIVIDGVISQVSALIAEKLEPGVRDFLIPSHISREPVSIKICEELGLKPVIDASMALGEGTGAALMFSLLNVANRVYLDCVPFAESGVGQYERF